MKVIIREAAYDDLDRISVWIAKDRPRSADSVIDRILESAERLGHFPYMGHVGRVPGTYEWVVPGLPYIIVYTINTNDDEVTVVAVFHGAQDR
jgi:addiction module RelE/StbE family toxin